MKRLGILLIVLLVLLVPPFALANTHGDAGLVVAAGTTRTGNVATFSEPIIVNGVVEGDVTSVTGAIVVRGSVEGDVISLFGDVTFEPQAVAEGNVMAAVGHVQMDAAPAVAGRSVFSGDLAGQGVSSLIPGSATQMTVGKRFVVALVLSLLGLVIAALINLIWPRSIGSAARALLLAPERATGLGVVWVLLSLLVVGLGTAVLVLSLVGLALLPLWLLLAQVPFLVGLAVSGRALSAQLQLHGMLAQVIGAGLIILAPLIVALFSLTLAFVCFYVLTGAGIGGLALLRVSVVYRNSRTA